MAFPAIRILVWHAVDSSVHLGAGPVHRSSSGGTYFLTKEVLIAQGEVRVANYLQVALQCLRMVGILAVIPFGLMGACWGLLVALWREDAGHTGFWPKIGLTFRNSFTRARQAWRSPRSAPLRQ